MLHILVVVYLVKYVVGYCAFVARWKTWCAAKKVGKMEILEIVQDLVLLVDAGTMIFCRN